MASRIGADRLERLTNLVLVLLATDRPMSLREIGDIVAGYPREAVALRRTFERDKTVLRENGIPLVMERPEGSDDQVGYRILPEHYYLPDLDLTPGEQLALGFALAAVRIEGGGPARDLLGKLGSPEVPDLPPIAVLPALPMLGVLQEAVRRRSIVAFSYHGRTREVEPYGLCFRAGSWYLVGREPAAGELRTFRVDRIDRGELATGAEGGFETPEGLDLREAVRFVPWRAHQGEATEVVVDVDAHEARAALDIAGAAALDSGVRRGGGVRLRLAVGDEEAFVTWIVGLGDAAVLVSPERMRTKVVERLRLLAAGGKR